MSEINEFVIYYRQADQSFGARRTTEILPNGSAPVAVVCEGQTLWQAGWGSLSFPYEREVGRAIASFLAFEDDYLDWHEQERPVNLVAEA